ncbi:MAG: prolyl oligopeptidase family serine peptidase [Armatimonadia bacterium]
MDRLNRFPQMMQQYLMRRVREAETEADERKFSMRTRKDALAYQEALRKKMRKVFGPLPRKTPLKPVLTGSFERDAYTVEKVMFESRPDFPVTASLYVPKGYDAPMPGVIAPCGHSGNGKAADAYQSFAQGLASKGYVVLSYDPVSQGERTQYPDGKGGSKVGICCPEHNHMGSQQGLVGEFFGTWRVWDGIRALDYLLTRPEVDPTRLGVTGNSGGGTLTSLIVANDDRYLVAGPGCYVTTWRRNAENELPADSEQQPPLALSLGMDMDDLFGLHAPKPLILLTQEKDFFDQRGALESFARLKHLYKLLGAEDNVAMVTGPAHHGFAQPLREAMYSFFNKACGKKESGKEPPVVVETDEQMQVTPTGQVSDLDRAPRTVFSFTAEKAQQLADKRKPLRGDDLRKAITKLLALKKRSGVPDYRILRPVGRRTDYPRPFATHFAVQTEPDIEALVYKLEDEGLCSRPAPGKQAVLYVPHQSSDEDLATDALVKELAEQEQSFFTVDCRGTGESQPNTCGRNQYLNIYGSDYFYASFGIMFGEPYVGWRVHDILSVLDWMESYGYKKVHLVGRGWGSVPAVFAAVLDPRVKQVTLKNAPVSFTEWATTEMLRWPLSTCPRNVLQVLDLPDCYAALKSKKLRLVEPWNAEMQPCGE